MEGKTYSIIRNMRYGTDEIETVVASGLSWPVADAQRNELSAAYRKENPGKSSWSGEIFIVRME